MKKLILAAALTLSFTAFAEESELDLCDELNNLARSVMNARQSGMEMRQLIQIVKENDAGELAIEIIIRAYEKPRFSVEKNKQNAIKDFQNEIYLQCIRSM